MKYITPALFFMLGLACFSQAFATTQESVAALENSVTALSNSIDSGSTLTSKLSDDVGLMADRIGEMADRIVETEILLSNTLITLTGSNNRTTPTVLLTEPLDGSTVSASTTPTFTLAPVATRYLLFASNSPLFPSSDTVSLLVDTSNTTLDTAWSLITNSIAQNGDIYISVRSIDTNDQQSDSSNSIKLVIQ